MGTIRFLFAALLLGVSLLAQPKTFTAERALERRVLAPLKARGVITRP